MKQKQRNPKKRQEDKKNKQVCSKRKHKFCSFSTDAILAQKCYSIELTQTVCLVIGVGFL